MFYDYYQLIYLLIVSLLTFINYNKYVSSSIYSNLIEYRYNTFIFAIALTFYVGLRPVNELFGDTVGYSFYYRSLMNDSFQFIWETENILFDNLLHWMASNEFSFNFWLTVCAFIYFVGRYWSCKKMFPSNSWAAYLVFLGAFSTYSYAVNGFKAGAAYSLFCVAIAYKDDKRRWIPLLFLALSYGFHHSMHVCIAAFIVCYFYNNTKVYLLFWFICFVLAVAHVSYFQVLFATITDESGARYLQADQEGAWLTGMRYDFVLYSIMPILLGWYIKYKKKVEIPNFDFILNLYIFLNGIWMLCMYASFTNRIAALSWLLYPTVLSFPFLSGLQIFKFNKNKIFAQVMLFNLVFTLFMRFIYYA